MRTALLAAGALLSAAACGAGEMSKGAAVDDVQCGSDEGGAVAEGTLTNISETTWAFEIVVEFYDVTGAYYTGATQRTPDLPPGATTSWDAHPNTPAALRGTCEVIDVVRLMPGGEATAFPTDPSPTTTHPVPPDGN